MILSRWQLVLTPTPHLHPLPFVREEAIRPLAGDAPALQHVLIAFCLPSHPLQLRRALATASEL
jgi:hypothetical protein